ncbi:MAG: reductive dehalogenase domain-containing protein [Methanobacteriaceae archaeon]|nr:reductive dehalogenase domain-containing protein [Methanobacteriaceae archaeon]MDP2836223.1 reductive dehalogenase domain-containing protein [Methanobacteriaceae archaeon]MDP3033670.1 reductive dehalogenase domain-containing protein [Methanobacteriaceae archaeon]MDP3484678.1 reductive dehalogenase domain-containing protein [Methanobacteriaceae archaeon]MDP3624711.1 reductive dehalogenase domain-containing protein [Methanobacteriaceae archaeon]
MDNNKCGCESKNNEYYAESEENKLDALKENAECLCDEKSSENEKESPENSGCGCDESPAETDDSGCGCGDVEYPDQSQVNNPENAEFLASEDFIKEFESYTKSLGISSIGYTQITSDLLIKDKFIPYPHTIVLTMPMSEDIIATAPGEEAQELNNAAYAKLGEISYKISDYLRKNGYNTQVAHPYEGMVNFSPLAQKAGLGWIGKSGLLMTPELGPRLKISAIFVSIANLPVKSENKYSWISDYCNRCSNCVKACPEKALLEKETCCGNNETELVQKLCIGCSQGCTYCIEDCPFHTKGYEHVKIKFDKMSAKLRSKNKNKCV